MTPLMMCPYRPPSPESVLTTQSVIIVGGLLLILALVVGIKLGINWARVGYVTGERRDIDINDAAYRAMQVDEQPVDLDGARW